MSKSAESLPCDNCVVSLMDEVCKPCYRKSRDSRLSGHLLMTCLDKQSCIVSRWHAYWYCIFSPNSSLGTWGIFCSCSRKRAEGPGKRRMQVCLNNQLKPIHACAISHCCLLCASAHEHVGWNRKFVSWKLIISYLELVFSRVRSASDGWKG